MNAPETHITEPINAAHTVLMHATEALRVEQVAKEAAVAKATATKQLKELNDLGLLETEFRKGGTPFYFLTVPAEMQASPDEMQVTSGEMQATSGVCNKCLGSGFLPKSMIFPELPDVMCPNGCKPPIDWTAPEMNCLAPEDYELPPADPEFLARANRELSQQLDAAKAERDDLRSRLDALTEQWEADTGRLTADLRAAIEAKSHAINEADRLRAELAAERQAREALQEQDDSVHVTAAAIGYLVRATKRKPRYITKPERAREAALSAVRAGAGRADVLAVVPVGSARRGAEWATPK